LFGGSNGSFGNKAGSRRLARFGGGRRQAAKLEQVVWLGTVRLGQDGIKPLEASGTCHSEARLGEVMSGGGVKTSPVGLDENLRVLKTQEGIGLLAELIPLLSGHGLLSGARP
jgi:hypothetical protein